MTSIQVAVCTLVCGSHCFIVHFILLTPLTVGRLLGHFQFGAVLHGLDFKVSTRGEIVHPSTILASSWVLRYTKHTSVSGPWHFLPSLLRMFFLPLPVWVTPSLYSGLWSKSFYQKVLPSLKQRSYSLTLCQVHPVLLQSPACYMT